MNLEFLYAVLFAVVAFGAWLPVSYYVNHNKFMKIASPCAQEIRDHVKWQMITFNIVCIFTLLVIAAGLFIR